MRKPYGSLHRLTTKAGSTLTVNSEVDEYGRGSSHRIVGFTPAGLSAYYARNVGARDVARLVRAAEAQGWTNVGAGIEGF